MKINKRILIVRTLGNLLLILAFVGTAFTFWPLLAATFKNTADKLRGVKFEAAVTAQPTQSFGSLLGNVETDVKILVPKDPNFSIIVEKIGADAPVIANVDAGTKAVYETALKRGVAHALGTSFPGQAGVSYLFAHSTDTLFNVPRYNAIFYLLGQMELGDRIVVFFNGRRYDYIVSETKITEASDVSYFTMETSEQILVLQTCYPPGTTWKRFLVIAKPAASATGSSSQLSVNSSQYD